MVNDMVKIVIDPVFEPEIPPEDET